MTRVIECVCGNFTRVCFIKSINTLLIAKIATPWRNHASKLKVTANVYYSNVFKWLEFQSHRTRAEQSPLNCWLALWIERCSGTLKRIYSCLPVVSVSWEFTIPRRRQRIPYEKASGIWTAMNIGLREVLFNSAIANRRKRNVTTVMRVWK